MRQASFKGLRADHPAKSIRREAVQTTVTPRGVSAIKVTNPDRVIDKSTGITKVELVRYYESVAVLMLPHLKDRPLSLVRAPDGIDAPTFFQKHAETALPGLTEQPQSLWPGHAALLTADSAEAIVAAAQMNVVEFHTWNAVRDEYLFQQPHLLGLIAERVHECGHVDLVAPLLFDAVLQVLGELEDSGYLPSAVLMHTSAWRAIRGSKNADGNYLLVGAPAGTTQQVIWALRVAALSQIPATDFVVLDNRYVAILDRQRAALEFSNSDGDNFSKNLVTVRAEERVGTLMSDFAATRKATFAAPAP